MQPESLQVYLYGSVTIPNLGINNLERLAVTRTFWAVYTYLATCEPFKRNHPR